MYLPQETLDFRRGEILTPFIATRSGIITSRRSSGRHRPPSLLENAPLPVQGPFLIQGIRGFGTWLESRSLSAQKDVDW